MGREETKVKEKIADFSTEKDTKSALKVQLYFCQKIIGSFTMPSGGKMKPITVFVDNLRSVCC